MVNIANFCGEVASTAGEHLLRWRTEGRADEADLLAHELILGMIERHLPDDQVLSEEGSARPALGASNPGRVWIIDPLDGTREYREGRSDWAVHVAVAEGGVLTAGAVALPARELTLSTDDPPDAPLLPAAVPRVVVSRTRRPAAALAIAERLGGEVIELGSAGAKAMAVVLGEADVYAHAGGINIWDVAAPAVVAAATGLHVSHLDGSPLDVGTAGPDDTNVGDILVCHPDLARRILVL